MLKHLSTALTVSTALTAGVNAATIHDFSMTEANRQAAASYASQANARTHREQTRWWDDFRDSGKNIVDHVADISASNPKAAMWFLLTGGRDGFSDREATPEERKKLETAMKNVAIEVYKSSRTAGAEMWRDLTEKYNQGHAHVQMLYKEVADLKETVRTQGLDITRLNGIVANQSTRIGSLEELVRSHESKINEQRGIIQRLEEKLVASEKRIKDSVDQALAAFKEQAREERQERERLFAAFMNPQARTPTLDISTLLTTLQQTIDTKAEEARQATAAKLQALHERDTFQAQLTAAREQIGVLEERIQGKEQELAALGQANQAMEEEIRAERQRLQEAQQTIDRLEREAAEERQRTAEQRQQDRLELERTQAALQALGEDLERERRARADAEARAQGAEQRAGVLQGQLTESDAKVAEIMSKQQRRADQRAPRPEDGRGEARPDLFGGDEHNY